MELIIIGCWGPYPQVEQACSGYLIKDLDNSILLDCGHGVASQLGKYIDINNLDAVFISHFHPDHYVDLYALRHFIGSASYKGERNKPLKVYMPGNPSEKYNYFSSLPELEVIEVKPGTTQVINNLQLRFYEMVHSVPSFAVKINNNKTTFFYSGDTAFHEGLKLAAQDADLCLIECSMLKRDSAYAQKAMHLTTEEAAGIAENSRAELFIATHFWPGYDLKIVEQEMASMCQKKFRMAFSGMRLTF